MIYDIYLPSSTYNHITNNKVCKIYYTETNIIQGNDCPYQTPPTMTLNSPENNSQVSNINATFNFTAIDNIDPSISCSLYLDSALNRTNSSVYNGSTTFFVVSKLGFGNHSWNVNCTDTDGNSNMSERRTITVGYVADADNNGKVDDFELLAYISTWASGKVSDFDLLSAIDQWAKG